MAGTFWPVAYWAPRYFEASYFGAGGAVAVVTSTGAVVVTFPTMEALLTSQLLASTDVMSRTGGIRNGELTGSPRISWDSLPVTNALPCVILHDLGASRRDYTFKGRLGLIEYRLQLDAWAGTLLDAIALRTALQTALAAMRTPPLQAFIIRDHGAVDLSEGPDAARHTDLHRRSLDIQLWFDPHQT